MFEDLIPELQDPAAQIVYAAGQAGLQPRVTSTRRTAAAQARLFRRWKAGQSPFPAAPPGTSAHEFGYAFDMVVVPMEALEDVGYTWQTWGGIWGPSDPIHFEYPGFQIPSQTLAQIAESAVSFIPTVGLGATVAQAVQGGPMFVKDPSEPQCTDPVSCGAWLAWKLRQSW